MTAKQLHRRNAIIKRAYQNGFEAGADEATKRFEARLARDNKAIAELVVKLTRAEIEVSELKAKQKADYNNTLQARMRALRSIVAAANELT